MSENVRKVISEKEIRVRYAETDKMGITYHSNYFVWFEVARIHLLDELGVVYKNLEAEGYFLPVVECNARFLAPVRFDDVVKIVTELEISLAVGIFLTTVKRGDNPASPSQGNLGEPVTNTRNFSC